MGGVSNQLPHQGFGSTPPARIHPSFAARETCCFGIEPPRRASPQNTVVIPVDVPLLSL